MQGNSNNKTISISPHLFQVSGGRGKTRKASKEKKAPVVIPPVVSPNLLKKKLIQRLKNHKARENKDLAPQVNNLAKSSTPTFVDEFNDSINYLQSLSNQSLAAAKRSDAQRRTLKRHYEDLEGVIPQVNLNLPEELNDSAFPALSGGGSLTLKTDVPYGNLKNGSKPTYRQYSKTLRNVPSILQTNEGGSLREKKLDNLRKKLDEMKKRKTASLQVDTTTTTSNVFTTPDILNTPEELHETPSLELPIEEVHIDLDDLKEKEKQREEEEKLLAQPVKQILKTTKHTKYTLGKNKEKQRVAVLLKNRSTRKKVLDACKKIKQEDIKNVKDYLKTHNFIKIGSNAPNHLYREMYKSLMLTGDTLNINKDTLLHNFSSSSL